MGITESNSKIQTTCPLDCFKLIRRYNCEAYGDVTVIQSKSDPSQMFALKQFIGDNDRNIQTLELRQSLTHKNLINLKRFWHTGDQSICSNLRNVCLMFQLCKRTLQDQVQFKIECKEYFEDDEIVKICMDIVDSLSLLSNNGFVHILGSMKSLLLDQDKTIKIIQNFQLTLYGKHKHINAMSLLNKKAIPLHPKIQPKDVTEVCINNEKICFQNLFTLGLLALGLCFLREPMELGIYNKNCYNFQKLTKRLGQVREKYPKTHKICKTLLSEEDSYKLSYGNILRQFSGIERSSFGKQISNLKLINIEPVEKIGQRRYRNRSYYKSFKTLTHDIPNQF